MRFVRICKIQFQPFGNSNSILNGFSRISPKHHGKRFFSRGFSHLSVPPQFLLFLTLFLLYCHPAFQISQCQCNRGSFSGSYPHAFVSQEIVIIIIIAIRKVLRLISVSVLLQEYGEEPCSSQDYFCHQSQGNVFVSYPKPSYHRVTE